MESFMFTWLNKQGVSSSDGFEFQFTGRFTAEYREYGRIVDLEVDDGAPIVTIHNEAPLSWRNGSNLSAEARARVFANIKAALSFMDLRLWENKPPLS
jgi:hypothetical protein